MQNPKQEENIHVTPTTIPILYTDTLFMNVNEDGVIIDVCQKGIAQNQVQVVARVGMSKSHAKKFVKKLSEILALTSSRADSTKDN
ncbi:MAG TPA: hypothetical protein PKA38_02155 [Candidatus Levybacteria bacterium]|nr:hypothetical protein [Candidatus Levybacteria bacterium]